MFTRLLFRLRILSQSVAPPGPAAGRETLRETDVLGRWGGEEFLLIMPEATLDFALASLERMRTMVFGIQLPASGAGLRVSLSAGLATSLKFGRSLT
jgi:diguanylate cyclase (GGDEF)-like protein